MIQPQNLKILVVEDESELRELLADRFKVFGFQVFEAEGGNSALKIVQEHAQNGNPIHTVVTDFRMPDGTGLELLQNLKAKDPVSPRVFLVSAVDTAARKEFFSCGAEGFLEKPYDTRVLIEMVRKSTLTNQERWRMPPNFDIEHKLEAQLPDFKTAQEQKLFSLGRGGFYLKTDQALPPLEQNLSFKISSAPVELSGAGCIKWALKIEGASYVGIEFIHLNGPGAEGVYRWIEEQKPLAYIPTP